LQTDIAQLEQQITAAKDKYSGLTPHLVAVDQQFKVKSSFKLLPQEACYLLSLEIQMPIELVTLQSDVPIMLLDIDESTAVFSRTQCADKDSSQLLATYRQQEPTNRMEIKIRTVEGQHGTLSAYIIPKLTPKTCQRVAFPIKALSLHSKISQAELDELLKIRPVNKLQLSGSFSVAEVHAWVGGCVPAVSPKVQEEEVNIAFRSTFLDTLLVCSYSRGTATFRSDSVSVISILKEVITKEATQKKTQISINLELDNTSIFTCLELLKPKMDYHFALARRHALIQPLKEVQLHEGGDTSYMSADYQEILEKADKISQEVKDAPSYLDFLRGIVTDLYADKHKLKGRKYQNKMAGLNDVLNNYSYEALLALFSAKDNVQA